MTGLICKDRLRMGVAATVVVIAATAFAAAGAHAQEPAICGQYEGLPQCLPDDPGDIGGDEGSGGNDDAGNGGDEGGTSSEEGGGAALPGSFPGSGGGASGDVSASGGELPFTGYPLTPLVWLLLILLAAGLVLRAYLALRQRLRARSAPGPA